MRRAKIAAALCGALAAVDSGAMHCTSAGTTLDFGQYQPRSGSPQDMQASIAIHCTPAYPGEMLNLRVRFLLPANPTLPGLRSPDSLRYRLYVDPARLVELVDTTVLSHAERLQAPATISLPLYGRLLPAQNVGVDAYRGRLSYVIEY